MSSKVAVVVAPCLCAGQVSVAFPGSGTSQQRATGSSARPRRASIASTSSVASQATRTQEAAKRDDKNGSLVRNVMEQQHSGSHCGFAASHLDLYKLRYLLSCSSFPARA